MEVSLTQQVAQRSLVCHRGLCKEERWEEEGKFTVVVQDLQV